MKMPKFLSNLFSVLRAVSEPGAGDPEQVVAQYHIARCDGCNTLPYITFMSRGSAHVMCTFPKCHAPRWTSTERDLPLDEAVGEWNRLNNTNASFNNIEVFAAADLVSFTAYLKARGRRTPVVTAQEARECQRRQAAATGSRDAFNQK